MVEGLVLVEEDVEVDISRTLINDFCSAHGPLNILKLV